MNVVAFVQARMNSTRLPGKVLMPLAGVPMLRRVVDRVWECPLVNEVCVVTGRDPVNQPIIDECAEARIDVQTGHDIDVLSRFVRARLAYRTADVILRITADCPCVDPVVLTRLLLNLRTNRSQYGVVVTGASESALSRYPDGYDAEALTPGALAYANLASRTPFEREHVTRTLWHEPRPLPSTLLHYGGDDLGHLRLTVDTVADYDYVSKLYDHLFSESRPFLLVDILAYLKARRRQWGLS